jgi:hypothetical protein
MEEKLRENNRENWEKFGGYPGSVVREGIFDKQPLSSLPITSQ